MPAPPCGLRKILPKNQVSVECSRGRRGGYPTSSSSRNRKHYILWFPTLDPEGPLFRLVLCGDSNRRGRRRGGGKARLQERVSPKPRRKGRWRGPPRARGARPP